MTRLLSLFGLMRVSEHERIVAENDEKAYAAWTKKADELDDMKMSRDDWQQKHNSVVGKLKMADNQTVAAVMARDETEAKYQQAVSDLEKQAGEIAELKGECVELRRSLRQRTNDLDHIEGQEELSERLIAELRDEIDALRPDALAMRRKRQMDRDRRKGRG